MNNLQVSYLPTDQLIQYTRNPRKNDSVVSKMVASIKEFGFSIPILATPDYVIVDGHLRHKAAQQLKMPEVPVIIADGWTEAQIKAFRLLANRSANWAEWDDDLLKLELEELQDFNFDLDLTGFDTDDLSRLLETKEEAVVSSEETEDETSEPEVPKHPVTKTGDVWILGKHRLICGDSTDREVVLNVLDGQRAALCFTSPPYQNKRNYQSDMGDWDTLMAGVFGNVQAVMAEDGQILINLGLSFEDTEWSPYWDSWIETMRKQGWRRFGLYVWDQGPGLPGYCGGMGRLASSYELIFHFNRKSRIPNKIIPCIHAGTPSKHAIRVADGSFIRENGKFNGTEVPVPIQDFRIPDNVIRVTRHKGVIGDCGDHPAVFPVGLPELIINTFTQPDEVVLEPFCGSGTQLIAAEKAGRRCCGIEISPAYADVAIQRWQEETSQDAFLESTGESFVIMKQQRLPSIKNG